MAPKMSTAIPEGVRVRIDRDASGASELAIPAAPGENEEPASA